MKKVSAGIGIEDRSAALALAYATDRLKHAERRLFLAKIERDEARRAIARAKESLTEARRVLREIQRSLQYGRCLHQRGGSNRE